jgi:hypothetical protein
MEPPRRSKFSGFLALANSAHKIISEDVARRGAVGAACQFDRSNCPMCGYPGPQKIDPEVTAARFFKLGDKF